MIEVLNFKLFTTLEYVESLEGLSMRASDGCGGLGTKEESSLNLSESTRQVKGYLYYKQELWQKRENKS